MHRFERIRLLPLAARPLYLLSHPLAIVPVATVVAAYFGSYRPHQINAFDVPLFLQGSTDWGGSNIFAATIAMYAVFGVLGAVHVMLQMQLRAPALSYLADLRANLWALRFHIFFFLIGGRACWAYDSQVTPNDFRNMFLFALLVYSISVAATTAIGRMRVPLVLRLALAPLAMYAWLWVGADGNTSKAGQTRQSGEDPLFQPRGARHRIMLAWHQGCDRLLGDR